MRYKETRIVPRLACALVATMVSLSLSAQSIGARPKLVVGIMVDGLSMNQIELLRSQFGTDGFNRLLREGVTLESVDYGGSLDKAAATAVIFTGTSPSVNGIDFATKFDTEKRVPVSVMTDPKFKGSNTNQTLSPNALLVSTISDELRIDGGGVGGVHTIALDPEQAIIMSSHAGNSTFWINNNTGNWATTTYYKDLPTVTQRKNHYEPLSSRLDTIAWTPALKLENYPDLPKHKKLYTFRHTFPKKDANRFKAFKASAPANREITQLATEYISTLSLGGHEEMDMLNLTYTVAPYPYTKDGDWRVQRQDSYIRLDRDLAQLFKAIERGPGMNNTVVFIAGTPTPSRTRRDDEKWNIPYGEFSTRKAKSLLNMYLIAKFGNGDWVSGFKDGQVYLNHTLIKQRGADLNEVRQEAAGLLAQMSGVTSSLTLNDLLAGRGAEQGETLKQNIAVANAGDIFISLAPGWEIVDEDNNSTSPRLVARATATTAPVFILAPNVEAKRIITPVDARAIAPTVAGVLRIRSPNGASTPALRLK